MTMDFALKSLVARGQGFEIRYDLSIPALLNLHTGLQSGKEFREHHLQLIKFYGEYALHQPNQQLGLICDLRHSIGVQNEDFAWLILHIVPRIADIGELLIAYIPPFELVAQRQLNELRTTLQDQYGVKIVCFNSLSDARQYIKQNMNDNRAYKMAG